MPDSYGYGYSDALRTRGELAPVTSFSSQSTYAVSTNKPQNFTEKDRLLCRKTMRQIFPFLPAPLRAAAFTSADRGNARENRVRPAVKLLHPHTLSSQADCPANTPPFFHQAPRLTHNPRQQSIVPCRRVPVFQPELFRRFGLLARSLVPPHPK